MTCGGSHMHWHPVAKWWSQMMKLSTRDIAAALRKNILFSAHSISSRVTTYFSQSYVVWAWRHHRLIAANGVSHPTYCWFSSLEPAQHACASVAFCALHASRQLDERALCALDYWRRVSSNQSSVCCRVKLPFTRNKISVLYNQPPDGILFVAIANKTKRPSNMQTRHTCAKYRLSIYRFVASFVTSRALEMH